MKSIGIEVIEAAIRILDIEHNAYPGLALSGSEESARLFHHDVELVAETIAELVAVRS